MLRLFQGLEMCRPLTQSRRMSGISASSGRTRSENCNRAWRSKATYCRAENETAVFFRWGQRCMRLPDRKYASSTFRRYSDARCRTRTSLLVSCTCERITRSERFYPPRCHLTVSRALRRVVYSLLFTSTYRPPGDPE